MPSPVDFPPELLAHVIAQLGAGELSSLMRVSKAYHKVFEPFLWSTIETHDNDHHSTGNHDTLIAEGASERPKVSYNVNGNKYPLQADKFIKVFSPDKGLQRQRQIQLGSLVDMLCLSLRPQEGIPPGWACFEHFANLAYLEISGYWHGASASSSFAAPKRSLSKLRVLRLRGYFPKAFVQWLLREPAGIEELQLAILDSPIGSSLCREVQNPPPKENRFPQDLSGEDFLAWQSKYEDLDQEGVAPRALACLTPDIIRRFANLKKLYLLKPNDGEESDQLYFSERSDIRIIEEWAALLKATRNTLEFITLDQRPVAEENCSDGLGNREYMRIYACGASYKRFVGSVLPILLESKEFPVLKAIHLFGFEAHDEKVDLGYYRQRMFPDDSVDVPGQLQGAFPNAEIIDGTGRRLVNCDETGETHTRECPLILCYRYDLLISCELVMRYWRP